MSIFELWLLTTVIPGLCGTFNVFAWALLIFLGIAGGIWVIADFDDDVAVRVKKYMKKAVIPFLVFAFLSSVMPNERQMLLIAGGYTATNNAEIKKLPTNAAKAVNAWLDAVTEAAEEKKK